MLPGDRRGGGVSIERWLSTEEAALEIGGVTARWVRLQVECRRLPARRLETGARATYRIRSSDLHEFMARYVREPLPAG